MAFKSVGAYVDVACGSAKNGAESNGRMNGVDGTERCKAIPSRFIEMQRDNEWPL